MKYTNYRDGGTMSFKSKVFSFILKKEVIEEIEICLDFRIGSENIGEWFIGYPKKDNSNKLTKKETGLIVPEIIERVEADVKWRNYYLEKLKKTNEL